MDEVLDVAHQTEDQIKYLSTLPGAQMTLSRPLKDSEARHRVVQRLRIRRVLNVEALSDTKTYLKAEVEEVA